MPAPEKPTLYPATYYLTRDTNSIGELSALVNVWYRRPVRCKLGGLKRGFAWLPTDPYGFRAGDIGYDPGLYGSFTVEYCCKAFGTIPETDRECVVRQTMSAVDN